ncbi:hypothetical protein GIS00_24120 [Nakamurella sp. YIM 132087]|uniref:Uncharacterized protein n=1 Tax=Nakamurella alba TaxID=2665158 RepID=A0A7K1FSB3_9ACTN|nr:hypothetical protein [Nakamurella alba]MTD17026.1 hypothetical protein [Nakamurella alba]
MHQLSFFSADLTPPQRADLGGVLAAHGQLARGELGCRLSILLDHPWRAHALQREFRVRDVDTESPAAAEGGEVLLRSKRLTDLEDLASTWTRGAVKSVPAGLSAGPGLLRCWLIAAGRPEEGGYVLGLDPRAPDTHEPLAGVLARAGVAGVLVGPRAGGPGLRIIGHRRRTRLAELIGTPPPEAPAGAFPDVDY